MVYFVKCLAKAYDYDISLYECLDGGGGGVRGGGSGVPKIADRPVWPHHVAGVL